MLLGCKRMKKVAKKYYNKDRDFWKPTEIGFSHKRPEFFY